MSLLQMLKQVFSKQNASVFDVPVGEQRSFLSRCPEPKDDLERSYQQYLCQDRLMKRGMPFLMNCAAVPLLLLYPLKIQRGSGEKEACGKQDAVLIYADKPTIVPETLGAEFQILQVKNFQSHLLLTPEDRAYLRVLRRRYPLAIFFRFKCMVKVAMYSHVIAHYAPKAVICSEEYSFTSSLLTDYCEKRGVEHINIMHGEKLYFIRDSFVHFHRFYVWDQHYEELFSDLRAEKSQFRIEVPPSLRLSRTVEPEEKEVDYTYYLGNEDREQLEAILKNLTVLRERGARIAIRLHPLYFDHSQFLCEDHRGFLIERPSELPFEESLLRTGCVMGLFSTVLLQAVSNGIPIVIDDLSDSAQYEKLLELQFICLKKEHRTLSELIKEHRDEG